MFLRKYFRLIQIEGQDYIDELTESIKAEDEEEKRRRELELQQEEEEEKEKLRLEELEAKKEQLANEAEVVKTPKSPTKSAKSSAKERGKFS